ncbi:MAG: MBL fold metallo-hydrolase [Candidatus Scalindua sp. AMX11]|nr:MAG: MBL fold metallo-hydrolase [Candidatus Scalindua sp.]NOG82693.1 MBL fold metallo-hydrolase [Planctomycetota bacterium]RZV95267.1 MAG: MBL fold metallo-hydrolase [Candidatus Scalindua sp. SCAELEC01]TDE66253.1 MAG: MBL fold metallo-hydrolase [Candidatus Scalindua sp. AMX11]GJQ57876.1 MAG: MBL fold hydrolase [Candidatus Scalindua sp.]
MSLQFHGATEGVTGTCHQISFENESILIDCGIFQGKEARDHSELKIDFAISNVKGLVLTHAHIDHVGRLPYLLGAGYTGPIYTSIPTAYLVPEQLIDALKIGFTRNTIMIQTVIKIIKERIVPCKYDQWITVSDTFRIKFHPAGHILGSAFIEVDILSGQGYCITNGMKRRRVVFSGDLGAPYTPILSSPRSPYRADILVLESTYGNRTHKRREGRRTVLLKILKKSLSDNGIVIIPAFAVGRTQELLYELNEIVESGKLPTIPVIVDSPLANRFVKLYSDLNSFWDKESKRRLRRGDDPFLFPGIMSIVNHREHTKVIRRLRKEGGPAIVIAGSGMCTGGRVINYLKNFLSDRRSDIIFIGYQSSGTLGGEILNYRDTNKKSPGYVMIDGKQVRIQAGVHEISGYSAHAGQNDLIRWVKGFRQKPKKIFLVHGEPLAKRVLKKKLNAIGLEVVIAKRKEYSM